MNVNIHDPVVLASGVVLLIGVIAFFWALSRLKSQTRVQWVVSMFNEAHRLNARSEENLFGEDALRFKIREIVIAEGVLSPAEADRILDPATMLGPSETGVS